MKIDACLLACFCLLDSIMNHLCFVPNIARRPVRWQEIVPKVANRSSRGPAESWDWELRKFTARVGPAKGRQSWTCQRQSWTCQRLPNCQKVGVCFSFLLKIEDQQKCIPLFLKSNLELWIADPSISGFFLSKFTYFLVANVHEELVQIFSTCLLKSLNFKWYKLTNPQLGSMFGIQISLKTSRSRNTEREGTD